MEIENKIVVKMPSIDAGAVAAFESDGTAFVVQVIVPEIIGESAGTRGAFIGFSVFDPAWGHEPLTHEIFGRRAEWVRQHLAGNSLAAFVTPGSSEQLMFFEDHKLARIIAAKYVLALRDEKFANIIEIAPDDLKNDESQYFTLKTETFHELPAMNASVRQKFTDTKTWLHIDIRDNYWDGSVDHNLELSIFNNTWAIEAREQHPNNSEMEEAVYTSRIAEFIESLPPLLQRWLVSDLRSWAQPADWKEYLFFFDRSHAESIAQQYLEALDASGMHNVVIMEEEDRSLETDK